MIVTTIVPRPAALACVLATLVTAAACTAQAPDATALEAEPPPRSVIFLISDGAGAAHWTLAAFADDHAAIRDFRHIGLVDTRGADHTVSGSAPTATAYATGVRTFMGAVGVGPDSVPVESVVEVAMSLGMSTGVISTTAITDATPAAFTAHVASRRDMAEIARQQSDRGLTVLMGGGRSLFEPGAQPDGRDLIAEARARGSYVSSVDELAALDADTVEALVGLFAPGAMGVVAQRGEGALTAMASTALEVLDRNPEGFFLMVENEESDGQSHDNADQATITAEMLDFDRLVRVALDYRAEHPETLVLVTGDHETGGLSLGYEGSAERPLVPSWSTGGHTGTLIPIFAAGPGAERFAGVIRNDEIGRTLLELLRAR